MDEAGRTTQPPLVMAPPGVDVEPGAEASAEAAPLPADTIGQARNGTVKPAASWADIKPEAAADAAAEAAPAMRTERKPTFTPGAPAGPASRPSPDLGPAPETAVAPETVDWSAPGPGPGPAPAYSLPDWRPAPEQRFTGQPQATDPRGPVTAPASPEASAPFAAAGFPSAAATAVTGTAAGLASSVASVWHRRGATDGPGRPRAQVRQPAKRQAMLTLARVEPWSVMKFSFVASVVAFIILFVAVAVLYMVLSALGVFDSIQHTVNSITSAKDTAGTNISHWFSASLILGYTALLGALNIVLITAISTIGSVIYNLIAKTIGGIEVTLRETD